MENFSSPAEAFKAIADATAYLKEAGCIRGKEVVGNYAEYLVALHMNAELAPQSMKAYDALRGDERIQVKSRCITSNSRILGDISSFDFDSLVAVLFNGDMSVHRVYQIPVAVAISNSNPRPNGNHRLTLSRKVISESLDITAQFI
ncbi:hypothetical protein Q6670_004105 [Salmonella enterica]|nr:hypothetical protein [Salmonella enterica]